MLITVGIVVSLILNVTCLFYIYKLEDEKEMMKRHIYDLENKIDRNNKEQVSLLKPLALLTDKMASDTTKSLQSLKEMLNNL